VTAARDPWFADDTRFPPWTLPPGQVAALARERLRGVPFPAGATPLRPILVRTQAYRALTAAAATLLELSRRALFAAGRDPAERMAALGIEDLDTYPLTFPDPAVEDRYSTCIARPDCVIGPAGPKFLEFNISGAVGGAVQTHVLTGLWRHLGAGAGITLPGTDPVTARAALFDKVAAAEGLGSRVAVLGSVRDLGGHGGRFFDLEVAALRRRGLRARFVEPEDLGRELDASGLPERLGLMAFTVHEWRQLGIPWEPARRALDRGCLLLASQTGAMVANKKVLAWLSEGRAPMSATERELVRRYVPWSRVVSDTSVLWGERRVGLADLVAARRESFVLKRAIGMKGLEVMVGLDAGEAAWRAALDDALRCGDSVVQEYVEPRATTVPVERDGRAEPLAVTPVLSPFLVDGRAAGCLVRYLPVEGSRVISARGFGAMEDTAMPWE
jgi:hypothetical protein